LSSAAAHADAALYAAKHGGRDKFVIHDPARHGRAGDPKFKLG
jgi:hypothetical protein